MNILNIKHDVLKFRTNKGLFSLIEISGNTTLEKNNNIKEFENFMWAQYSMQIVLYPLFGISQEEASHIVKSKSYEYNTKYILNKKLNNLGIIWEDQLLTPTTFSDFKSKKLFNLKNTYIYKVIDDVDDNHYFNDLDLDFDCVINDLDFFEL